MAVVVVEGGEQVKGDDVEVGDCCGERGLDVNAPVGGAVADHEAFHVDLEKVTLEFSLQVILVDLPGEVGHIDSTV